MGAEVAGGQLEKGAAREREDGGNVWVSRAERYSMDEAADTGSLQPECELTVELAPAAMWTVHRSGGGSSLPPTPFLAAVAAGEE